MEVRKIGRVEKHLLVLPIRRLKPQAFPVSLPERSVNPRILRLALYVSPVFFIIKCTFLNRRKARQDVRWHQGILSKFHHL